MNGVIGDCLKLRRGNLTVVTQNSFNCTDINYFSDADTVLIKFYQLTLNRHGKLVDNRCIHKR